MARQLLRDTSETARQIMDGELDDQLEMLQQAIAARRHNLYKPGSRVRAIGVKNADLAGQIGTIIKVNPKRITVGFGEQTEWGFEREFNMPLSMLEIVTD
jgi:hypothetical protein